MQSIILQCALKHLLDTHKIDISALDGKIVHFSLQDLPINVNFICTNGRIFVTNETTVATNVDIELQASGFLAMVRGQDIVELLRQDSVVINGDVKTAQLLVDLLQQVDIDFEEELSKLTGDIIAHQVGKIAKKIKSSDNPISAFKDKVASILIQPVIK